MVFTVELQETMSFGLWILAAGVVMLALAAAFFMLYRRLRSRLSVIENSEGKEESLSLAALNEAKERYLKELDKIGKAVEEGSMTPRAAYQRMSLLLRSFACEVNSVPAQFLTLKELRLAKIPSVFSMVIDYYGPEFSAGTEADSGNSTDPGNTPDQKNFRVSLEKTRKVIKQWT